MDRLQDLLCSEASEAEVRAVAVGAARRGRAVVATVVTQGSASAAVQRERHRAVGTHRLLAALAAQEARRVATAVQEEECLLPALEARGECGAQRGPEDEIAPGLDHLPPIHDFDPREPARPDATGHGQPHVLALEGVGVGLDGRRGRAEEHGAPLEASPHHRHVPAVIARALVLLVGPVVLLVHHDHPEVGHGGEDCRARSHRDPGLALPDPPPLVVALARRELAVEDGHGGAETRGRRAHEEGCERDLGDEDEGAPVLLEGGLDGSKVNLRFAAAGDPVQKERAALARANGLEDRLEDLLLVFRGIDRHRARHRKTLGHSNVPLLLHSDNALFRKSTERPTHRGPTASQLVHPGTPPRCPEAVESLSLGATTRRRVALDEHGDLALQKAGSVDRLLDFHHAGAPESGHTRLRVASEPTRESRQAERLLGEGSHDWIVRARRPADQPHDGAARPHAGRGQDEPKALADGGQVVLGHPRRKVEEWLQDERGLVEDRGDVPDFDGLSGGLRRPDRDADYTTPSERDHHTTAPLGEGHVVRHAVGERGLKGQGHGHRNELPLLAHEPLL